MTDAIRDKYRVRHYNYAVHSEYNGFNPFEAQVAAALDATGLLWCRNPAKSGYGIPITELGADVIAFYPDFLLWTDKQVWAIDPKGAHLKESAVQTKLFDVVGVEGVTVPVRVALILDGTYELSKQGSWSGGKKDGGFTIVRRTSTGIKSQKYVNLLEMIRTLKGN